VTTAARPLDDLDRLAFRLVRTIRQHHPQLRDRGFTLTDLEERLLPYRETRREMADTSAHAWKRTVLRLVSGERAYVEADADLKQACRHALSSPSPTIALVRSWSGTPLMLGALAEQVGGERVSGAFEAAKMSADTPLGAGGRSPLHSVAAPVLRAQSGSISPGASTAGESSSARKPNPRGAGCRYCGGRLPDARAVTFCPHCGLDQTKRQCPACSTELEAAWRFCVTCGRNADLPDLPVQLKRAAG